MIAERNSKTYRIRQFIGKTVRIEFVRTGDAVLRLGRIASQSMWDLVECDQFSATFRDQYRERHDVSLDRIDILTQHEWPYSLVLQIRN